MFVFSSLFENLFVVLPCVNTVIHMISWSNNCTEDPCFYNLLYIWTRKTAINFVVIPAPCLHYLLSATHLLCWDFFPLNFWFTSISKCHQFSNLSKVYIIPSLFHYLYYENFIQVLGLHNFHQLLLPPTLPKPLPLLKYMTASLIIIIITYTDRYAYINSSS